MVLRYTILLAAVYSLPNLILGASLPNGPRAAPKAIYYMTNDVLNEGLNAIVAIPVASNGLLGTPISTTLTGGLSGSRIDPSTGELETPDALASAGAVQVVGQNLFAINPGSNSISMFRIDARNATKLTLLGEPQNTKGDFPVSLAVSSKHRLVCVANGGTVNGIVCASYSPSGLGPMDALRSFNLSLATPPIGLPHTVSHTFFSSTEDVLYSIVKGIPASNATVNGTTPSNPTGFLSASRVIDGQVAYTDTRSSPNGTSVLFGATLIPNSSSILAADFAYGAAIISVDAESLLGSTRGRVVVPGNVANCWAAYSPASRTAFTTDGLYNQIAEIDVVGGGKLVSLLRPANGNYGMGDVAAVGDWLYALSPNRPGQKSGLTVFDVSGGPGSIRQVQEVVLGAHNYAAGMAWKA